MGLNCTINIRFICHSESPIDKQFQNTLRYAAFTLKRRSTSHYSTGRVGKGAARLFADSRDGNGPRRPSPLWRLAHHGPCDRPRGRAIVTTIARGAATAARVRRSTQRLTVTPRQAPQPTLQIYKS